MYIQFFLVLTLFIATTANAFAELTSEQITTDYVNGIRNENVDLITKHYTDSTRLMIQANPSIVGQTNAKAYFSALFNEFEISKYTRRMTEVVDMGSHQAEVGNYFMSMKNSKGEQRELVGSYLLLRQVSKSGQNIIMADVWNFNQEIGFSDELSFENVPSVVTALEAHLPINSPVSFELAAYSTLMSESVTLRDPKVLSQFYSENATILPNSKPPINGINNIQTYWDKHINEIVSLEGLLNRTVKIEDLGKFIIQYSAHIAAWRSGQYSGVSTGKHLRIWERQADGRIKTRILISAYDK